MTTQRTTQGPATQPAAPTPQYTPARPAASPAAGSLPPLVAGWSVPSATPTRRLIAAVSGLEKMGKDFFALTASLDEDTSPVFLHNFDYGLEGVVEQFLVRGGKLFVAQYRLPKGWRTLPEDQKKLVATKAHDEFERMWDDSVARGKGTIIVDTHSEEWEVRRVAKFGKLTQVMPHNYGEVNNEFREMVRDAYDSGMNIIFLQKEKPEYVNNNKTGKTEPSGYTDLPFVVQTNLKAYRDPNDMRFKIFIKDCRQNASLAGKYMDVHDNYHAYRDFLNLVFTPTEAAAPTPPTPPTPPTGLNPELAALLAQNGMKP